MMVPQSAQPAFLHQALLVLQVPVIGFIGRLDFQKGADLVLGAAKWLLETQDVQLICLGTGDASLEVTHSYGSHLRTSCLMLVVLGRMGIPLFGTYLLPDFCCSGPLGACLGTHKMPHAKCSR